MSGMVPAKQVEYCEITGKLAGREQKFEGVIYQKREFIKIKFYPRHQMINAQKKYQKLLAAKIPAIIIKEKRGYSLWLLLKSLLTQKHSIDSGSDLIRASVKQQGFNQFKPLAILAVISLIGTVILASEMRLLIPQQTMQACKQIESICPGKIKALEKLTPTGRI